ncbi:MAG: carboxypeptidase regulatory-like domain-containing protein, partial [Solirubrobacteraceae bacterium]|nr:carboxypeptidase regulatory-like domain-containing protein [Solirubrobacteraceae bacterium]
MPSAARFPAPSNAPSRRLVAALLAVLLALFVAPAAAAASGTISGSIRSASGPLAGSYAVLYDGPTSMYKQTVLADDQGRFSVSLAAGQYRVALHGPGDLATPGYVYQQYATPGAAAGTWSVLTLADGQTIPDVDATLAPAGGIRGQLSQSSGAAVSSGDVTVTSRANGTTTVYPVGVDGSYRIRGLAPGAYTLRFADRDRVLIAEYYDDAVSFGAAKAVDVEVGSFTTGIDAVLRPGGRIVGRVVDAAGEPIANALISAFAANAGSAGSTRTDATGRFAATGLASGAYSLYVAASGPGYLIGLSSSPVNVTEPGTTTVSDIVLSKEAKISGRVSLPGGASPAGMRITATRATGAGPGGFGATIASASGDYTITGLGPGSYYLTFSNPFSGTSEGDTYATAYGTNSSPTPQGAGRVDLADGEHGRAIDYRFKLAATLSGAATNRAGVGQSEAVVELFDATGVLVARQPTAADGGYEFKRLPPGVYRVGFQAPGSAVYAGSSAFYANAESLETATPITLSEGEAATGKSLAFAHLGILQGRLKAPGDPGPYDPDGPAPAPAPVPGTGGPRYDAEVGLWDASGRLVASRMMIAGQDFSFGGLAAGQYRVGLVDPGSWGYDAAFYAGKSTLAAATPVAVDEENSVRGIYVDLVGRGLPNPTPTPTP